MSHRSQSNTSRGGGPPTPYDRNSSGRRSSHGPGGSDRRPGGYGGPGSIGRGSSGSLDSAGNRDSFRGGYGGPSGSNAPGGGYPDRGGYGSRPDRGPGGGDRSFGGGALLPLTRLGPIQPRLRPTLPVLTHKKVLCNAKELDVRRAIPVYEYDLLLTGFKERKKNEKGDEIHMSANNDASRNAKYLAFNEIFYILLRENVSLFKTDEKDDAGNHKHLYVFDRSRKFYCDLDLIQNKEQRLFTIDPANIEYSKRTFVRQFKRIEVRLVKTGYLDVKQLLNVTEESQKRPYLTYLDHLFNQSAYQQDKFYVFGPKMFLKEAEKSEDYRTIWKECFELKEGIQKSVKSTKDFPILQVDRKQSVFYTPMPVLTYLDIMDVPERDLTRHNPHVTRLLKGITVRTEHLKQPRTFALVSLTKLSAENTTFKLGDKETSVKDYFKDKYNHTLKFPHFVCGMTRDCVFPLEVLTIIPGQRVPREKMSDKLQAEMIRGCQTLPRDVHAITKKSWEDADLRNNPILKVSGVRIKNPIETDGEVLPKPAILYKNGIQELKQAGWKQDGQYSRDGMIKKLAIITAARHDIHLDKWASNYVQQAKKQGLTILKYEFCELREWEQSSESVRQFALDKKREGFDFLLFLGDSKDLHEAIKYSEIKTEIPTQQVKIFTLKKNGRDTMANVIHKMNLKAGGRNFGVATAPSTAARLGGDIVRSILNDTVIIGIEMSHPGAQSRYERLMSVQNPWPTSVGVAYTHDNTANIMHGDYFFIKRGSDVIKDAKLTQQVMESVKLFHSKMQHYPSRVLIYRSGISEGSFAGACEHECQKIVDALAAAKIQSTVTMVVIQRKSNHRIFRPERELEKFPVTRNGDKPPKSLSEVQNVDPGTTIWSGVTNANYQEFIMQPHKSQLGTSKPIVGTVIFESTKGSIPFDHIKHLTHAQCYHLEIVTAPIAMPGVLRSASDLATRGLNNYKHWERNDNNLPHEPEMSENEKKELGEEQEDAIIQRKLDERLPLVAPTIKDRRWWA